MWRRWGLGIGNWVSGQVSGHSQLTDILFFLFLCFFDCFLMCFLIFNLLETLLHLFYFWPFLMNKSKHCSVYRLSHTGTPRFPRMWFVNQSTCRKAIVCFWDFGTEFLSTSIDHPAMVYLIKSWFLDITFFGEFTLILVPLESPFSKDFLRWVTPKQVAAAFSHDDLEVGEMEKMWGFSSNISLY